ncbi:MAG: O-antigen ligase family protein [Candidatus Aegiribacteria sp.]|nr:O-antigen ligase family protein [Candidatus Aegiribacteria sp.]
MLLLWFDQKSAKKRFLQLIIVSIIITLFVIVIATGARTPTLVFGLVLIIWLRKNIRYIFALSVITILGLYIANSIVSEEIKDRYIRAHSAITSGHLEEAANVEFRYEHLMVGIEAFFEAPIFGHGHDSWMGIIGEKKGIIGYNIAPHNEAVRLIVEYGFLGLVIFSMFIYTCCRTIPKRGDGPIIQSSRYALAIIVGSMVSLNFFHNALFTRHFFFLLGATAGLLINHENTSRNISLRNNLAT